MKIKTGDVLTWERTFNEEETLYNSLNSQEIKEDTTWNEMNKVA
jgi:hypothetical protein